MLNAINDVGSVDALSCPFKEAAGLWIGGYIAFDYDAAIAWRQHYDTMSG